MWAAWAEAGAFPIETLAGYRSYESDLEGHPTPRNPWVDVATGSLGQGLAIATGMAMGFIGKDLRIAVDTAKSIGGFAPLAERVSELWSEAVEKLGYSLDQSEVARYWEEANGVSLEFR